MVVVMVVVMVVDVVVLVTCFPGGSSSSIMRVGQSHPEKPSPSFRCPSLPPPASRFLHLVPHIQWVLDTLVVHADDGDVVETCMLLLNRATWAAEVEQLLGMCSGLVVITTALDRHIGRERLACHALRCLWHMSVADGTEVNVNELRLGFSNTTRNPEGILSGRTLYVRAALKAYPPPIHHHPSPFSVQSTATSFLIDALRP